MSIHRNDVINPFPLCALYQSSLLCMYPTGMSKPSLKLLQRNKVITAVSAKWYQLGIVLLEDERVNQLANIRANNNNVTDRCYEMFGYWIQTQPKASWEQLVEALSEPGVEMNDVAETVKRKFIGMSVAPHLMLQVLKSTIV